MERKETIARLWAPSDSRPDYRGGHQWRGFVLGTVSSGVDALLIDKRDFMAGASAAPSGMIHGGLRYLENREVRLVWESLSKRNRLLQNAPHYVKPCRPSFQSITGRRALSWCTEISESES